MVGLGARQIRNSIRILKKIPSLFKRDYDTGRVYDELEEGVGWVLLGEGIATRKRDGKATMFRDGSVYKRYDAKHGKTPPSNFEPCQDPDPVTGHWPGWIPIEATGKADAPMREAFQGYPPDLANGTYEVCGPKINSDPEGFGEHFPVPHGAEELPGAPRSFTALMDWFSHEHMEGIVWHHPDGRMVKIKARDFGLPWPAV